MDQSEHVFHFIRKCVLFSHPFQTIWRLSFKLKQKNKWPKCEHIYNVMKFACVAQKPIILHFHHRFILSVCVFEMWTEKLQRIGNRTSSAANETSGQMSKRRRFVNVEKNETIILTKMKNKKNGSLFFTSMSYALNLKFVCSTI